MEKKVALIFNPVAGKSHAEKYLPVIKKQFEYLGIMYELFQTERVGHAQQIAQENCAKFPIIAVAGGDGTCNEAINGIMAYRKLSGGKCPDFAVIPVGRGNDFSYGAGVPKDVADACRIIADQTTRALDVGRITGGFYPEGKYFANGIGIGFDTVVGLNAAKHKNLHGAMSYLAGVIDTFKVFNNSPKSTISYNGKTEEYEFTQISILNGRRMGGLFYMAPESDISDGKLDLCMTVQALTRVQMIKLLFKYFRGSQIYSSLMKTARSFSYEITAPNGGLVCHADGETVCTDGTHLFIECVPSALRIFTKPGLPSPLSVISKADA